MPNDFPPLPPGCDKWLKAENGELLVRFETHEDWGPAAWYPYWVAPRAAFAWVKVQARAEQEGDPVVGNSAQKASAAWFAWGEKNA